MRNLKRALSLAMASVMTLGMMTVGASAAGIADFSDAAEITNIDAVAVTSAIGIFEGYDDGEFKGDNIVTRAQMAVICCKMLYGDKVNVSQFAELNTFTDVADWQAGWVNLANSLGIVVGNGDGTFSPDATVTTAQAATMLAKTLGYFKNPTVEMANGWEMAAISKATEIGLFGDLVLETREGLTRDNVAEMTFNALTQAVPVQYNDLLGVYYNENQGIVYALKYNYLETLGYKNFSLVYRTDETMEFGRPGTTWGIGKFTGDAKDDMNNDGTMPREHVRLLSSDEIVTIADEADYTFTGAVKEKDLYKTVGKTVASSKYTWDKWVNDVMTADVDAPKSGVGTAYDETGRGVMTEVYIDSTEGQETVTVVYVNQYLGEVAKVKENDDGEEVVTIKVLSDQPTTVALDDKTFIGEGYEKGDLVVFTMAVDNDNDTYIAGVCAPEVVSGTVTAVEKSKASGVADSYIELDGVKYSYNVKNAYDVETANEKNDPELNASYDLYLDATGYIVGFKATEDVTSNYLYVKAADAYLNAWQAKVVFADGTTAVIDVKDEFKDKSAVSKAALVGKVFAYSVNSKGVYTLDDNTVVTATFADLGGDNNDLTIENKSAWLQSGDLTDTKTVFVDAKKGDVVYVGYENVPNVYDADYFALDTDSTADGTIDLVFITDYSKMANKDNTMYYVADWDAYKTFIEDNTKYVERVVYVDGEKVSIVIEAAIDSSVVGLYEVEAVNDKGYVTDIKAYGNLTANTTNPAGIEAPGYYEVSQLGEGTFVSNQSIALDNDTRGSKAYWQYNDETIFVVVDLPDEKASVGNASDIVTTSEYDPDEAYTFVAVAKANKNLAELVYIIEIEAGSVNDNAINQTAAGTDVEIGADAKILKNAEMTDDLEDKNVGSIVPKTAVTLTFELDESLIINKAVSSFDADKTYIVVINQQECVGYISGNKLIVTYYLTEADVATIKAGKKVEMKVEDVNVAEEIETATFTVEVDASAKAAPYYSVAEDTKANYTVVKTSEEYDAETGVSTIEFTVTADDGYVWADEVSETVKIAAAAEKTHGIVDFNAKFVGKEMTLTIEVAEVKATVAE